MKGNRDVNFFDKINMLFVCLITATIHHCFKECRSGKETTERVEFKYEIAAGKFISDIEHERKTK